MTVPGVQLGPLGSTGPVGPAGPAGATGATGATGAAGVGAAGLWTPTDHGCVAWTTDPGLTSGPGLTWSAGLVYLYAAKMQVESPITSVGLMLRATAAAGLANTFLGVYTVSGTTATRIGVTPDISSTMNGVAVPTAFALTTPTASLPAGTRILLALLYGSASTGPAAQGYGTARNNAFIASKANWRSLVSPTGGITSLPSTIDLTTYSDASTTMCVTAL